jgi:hypothetical protein
MPGTWAIYWNNQSAGIRTCLQQWKQSGNASMILTSLSAVSTRKDLYKGDVTVTNNGPSSNAAGKQHLLDLARVVAPMLAIGDSMKISIVSRNGTDYLDFI